MITNWKKEAVDTRGTSRKDRILQALMPENIRIDARELYELLAFAARSAKLIQYVNPQNEPAGNWADYLGKDPSIFLALLLENRPQKWDNELRGIIRKFYATQGEGKINACREMIHKIIDMALQLNEWYVGSEKQVQWGAENPVATVLRKAIQPEGSAQIETFRGLILATEKEGLFSMGAAWQDPYLMLHPVWNLKKTPTPYSLSGKEPDDKLQMAVEEMRQIFQGLYFPMIYLSEKAPEWFWESMEQKKDHEPHTGLLLAFLKLFLHARDQLNGKTTQHLDHYYFDLLQQRQLSQIPDRTMVCFQLADHVEEYLLEQGTRLLAGVNEQGLESHYATMEDLLVGKAQVAALKTVYVSKSNMMKAGSSYKLVSGIYAATMADSQDGQGTPFGPGDRSWPVFGEEQLAKNQEDRRMVDARVGFVIAAPVLALQEGDRKIDIGFQFTTKTFAILIDLIDDISENTKDKREEVVSRLFNNCLKINASGPAGWFPIDRWAMDSPGNWLQTRTLTLSLFLSPDDPAITDNQPEILGETFNTPWPLLKILLNPDHNIYLYSFVLPLELETVQIETSVKGLKSLTLLNEAGLLDASAPFMPFGPMPNRNAYLLLGSAELFRKRLSELSIQIQWNNLPEVAGGFATVYKAYNPDIDNKSFEVNLSALSNYTFKPAEPERRQPFSLFSEMEEDKTLLETTTIGEVQLSLLQIQPDYGLRRLPEYTNATRCGYFKLQLFKPSMAFGHADYPRLFSLAMIGQVRPGGLFGRSGEEGKEQILPHEPYTPVINKVTVDYKARTVLNMRPLESIENDPAAGEKIICLHPLGYQEIFADGKAIDRSVFPRFDEDGYLYIGLKNAKPGRPITLFFHIRESKQNFRNNLLELRWSYLRANVWEPFTQEQFLSDSTRQFTTSGIIKMIIPPEITSDNTILPAGLCWIRAAAKGRLEIVGRALDVQVNAVETIWVDNGDETHFDPKITLPLIHDLVKQRAEIAALTQPVGFYGGRPTEELADFYVRTSERLRHKNRAVTIWDIERLVLEHFPHVRRAKCIGWMEYPPLQAGEINVVVVPQADASELEPMLGFQQLDNIEAFLKEKTSPFVQIQVVNPVYEKIKITCLIRLEKGLENDKGKYLQLLNEELLHYICPWLHGSAIEMGGSISKNEVLAFIKSRPYIRFATKFSLVQIYENPEAEYLLTDTARELPAGEMLQANTPWSVLTPVTQHNIQFISSDEHVLPEAAAIEDMRLGTDFIILEGPGKETQSSGLTLLGDESDMPETEWFLFPK